MKTGSRANWVVGSVMILLAVYPFADARIRYPATLKSVVSPDGYFTASICWMPMRQKNVAAEWISLWMDLVFPDGIRVFAIVHYEDEKEPLFWVPLSHADDVPSDYSGAKIVWNGKKVSFFSMRSNDVHIDIPAGSVQTNRTNQPNQAVQPTPGSVTPRATEGEPESKK